MPPMTLRINREGSFTAHADSEHPNQCGRVGLRHYKYFVTIEASNGSLTHEGYVMENQWVDDYFQNRYTIPGAKCGACETMAQDAVAHFRDLFTVNSDLQRVDVRRIYVRLHGSEYSFIEAEWKRSS